MQSQNLWRIDLSHFCFRHSSKILVFFTVTNVFDTTIFFHLKRVQTNYALPENQNFMTVRVRITSAWELGWSMCLQGFQ